MIDLGKITDKEIKKQISSLIKQQSKTKTNISVKNVLRKLAPLVLFFLLTIGTIAFYFQKNKRVLPADPNEFAITKNWIVFEATGSRILPVFFRRTSGNNVSKRVLADLKTLRDDNLDAFKSNPKAIYIDDSMVFDCSTQIGATYASAGFDKSHNKLFDKFFGDPNLITLEKFPEGSIGNSLASLLCKGDLWKPIAQKSELNSKNWIRLFTYSDGGDLFLSKTKPSRNNDIVTYLVRISYPDGKLIGEQTVLPSWSNLGVRIPFKDLVQIESIDCRNNTFTIDAGQFYDSTANLIGIAPQIILPKESWVKILGVGPIQMISKTVCKE